MITLGVPLKMKVSKLSTEIVVFSCKKRSGHIKSGRIKFIRVVSFFMLVPVIHIYEKRFLFVFIIGCQEQFY